MEGDKRVIRQKVKVDGYNAIIIFSKSIELMITFHVYYNGFWVGGQAYVVK